jgi:hypothetical protein
MLTHQPIKTTAAIALALSAIGAPAASARLQPPDPPRSPTATSPPAASTRPVTCAPCARSTHIPPILYLGTGACYAVLNPISGELHGGCTTASPPATSRHHHEPKRARARVTEPR